MPLLTRALKIALNGNSSKLEGARYPCELFKLYTQHWVTQLYYLNFKSKRITCLSTRGMGQLANQAQHKAVGILRAHFASVLETGSKSNVPHIKIWDVRLGFKTLSRVTLTIGLVLKIVSQQKIESKFLPNPTKGLSLG